MERSGARLNLLRLQKLIKQAAQSDFSHLPLDPTSRFYNAAMEVGDNHVPGLDDRKT